MHMLYNSDSFVVVQFDIAGPRGRRLCGWLREKKRSAQGRRAPPTVATRSSTSSRGKEIFIQGRASPRAFKEGVEALIQTEAVGRRDRRLTSAPLRFADAAAGRASLNHPH